MPPRTCTTYFFSRFYKKIEGRDTDPAFLQGALSSSTPYSTLIKQIYEFKLQQKLDTTAAFDFSKEALQQGNLKAIEILAESYPRVVAETLPVDTLNLDLILESSSLYFQLKLFLTKEEKQLILRKLIPRLFHQAEQIFKRIDRTRYPKQVLYMPGRQWDIERTIFNFLQSGDTYFTYNHVVTLERKPRLKDLVLLIDKSHSVLLFMRKIILASILFSLSLEMQNLSVIGFDTKPEMIKSFSDIQMARNDLIHELVELTSGGKTDVYTAVKAAKKELDTRINARKTLIIISDLLSTSGYDFLPLLATVKDVRIILTPLRQTMQLTAPILGRLRRLPNVKLFHMPRDDQMIPQMLEKVIFS